MKISKKIFIISVLFVSSLSTLIAAKPKRTMVIDTVATSAATNIENAKNCISNGNYEKAEYFLENAYKMAMSVDNMDLLSTICVTKISTFLSETPAKVEEAKVVLQNAKYFAENSNNKEKNLALYVLSEVRIDLAGKNPDYNSCSSKLEKNKLIFVKDLYETAQFSVTQGDIYRLQEKYSDAEKSYQSAIDIFTKECYLSELGLSWYKLAQVRSLNKNKKGALEALNNAIKYDRDAENSNALGTDYYVKAVILLKDNPTKEEKSLAKIALQHSADIFIAADLVDLANKSLEKLDSIK